VLRGCACTVTSACIGQCWDGRLRVALLLWWLRGGSEYKQVQGMSVAAP
jgi:hypothetical protein